MPSRLEEIDKACHLSAEDKVHVFRCLETDMRHIRIGAGTGATPDGRHAGKPISENTSPYPGSCKYGLTAMFKSAPKLPLNRINSGALNVRIQPRLVSGENGLMRMASLLRTYLDMGGLQIQISLADTEELRDAQIHRSIIGAGELNFCVRNGNGCFPSAIVIVTPKPKLLVNTSSCRQFTSGGSKERWRK